MSAIENITENVAENTAAVEPSVETRPAVRDTPMHDYLELDDIRTDELQNSRSSMTGVPALVSSILSEGRITQPVSVYFILDLNDNGDPIDADGNVVDLDTDEGADAASGEFHLVSGHQRVAAMKEIRRQVQAHNKRVEEGTLGELDGEALQSYPFTKTVDGTVVPDDNFVEFDFGVPAMVYEAYGLTDQVRHEAFIANAQENITRLNLPELDKAEIYLALSKEGLKQREIAARLGVKQPTVSQGLSVARNCCKAVKDALRDNDIKYKQAVKLAGLVRKNGKNTAPDAQAQQAELKKLLSGSGVSTQTKRTSTEIANFRRGLLDENMMVDVDPVVREAILRTFSWLNMGCEMDDVLHPTTGEVDHTIALPALKEPKSKTAAEGEKKKKKPAAKKPAAKKPAAAAEAAPKKPAPKKPAPKKPAPKSRTRPAPKAE